MPGFEAFKDRLIVFLGGNVAGYKLKPFLIWHGKNSSVFKHINQHTLPVYYRSNEKSLVSQLLFQYAHLNCYAREVDKYSVENDIPSIPFKFLLIVDNVPGNPSFIGNLHPNFKIMFLLLNISSLIQPMNKVIIAVFMACYLRRTFAQAIAAAEEDAEKTLMQFWDYSNPCLHHPSLGLGDVTKKYINGTWKKTFS